MFNFFFFKQKTAYEMRISDWSSDVCSSDLRPGVLDRRRKGIFRGQPIFHRYDIVPGQLGKRACEMVVVGDAADRPAASVKKDDRAARGFLRRVDANRNAADVTILDTDHPGPALGRKLREQPPPPNRK